MHSLRLAAVPGAAPCDAVLFVGRRVTAAALRLTEDREAQVARRPGHGLILGSQRQP